MPPAPAGPPAPWPIAVEPPPKPVPLPPPSPAPAQLATQGGAGGSGTAGSGARGIGSAGIDTSVATNYPSFQSLAEYTDYAKKIADPDQQRQFYNNTTAALAELLKKNGSNPPTPNMNLDNSGQGIFQTIHQKYQEKNNAGEFCGDHC